MCPGVPSHGWQRLGCSHLAWPLVLIMHSASEGQRKDAGDAQEEENSDSCDFWFAAHVTFQLLPQRHYFQGL
jgi:hypothetical protein